MSKVIEGYEPKDRFQSVGGSYSVDMRMSPQEKTRSFELRSGPSKTLTRETQSEQEDAAQRADDEREEQERLEDERQREEAEREKEENEKRQEQERQEEQSKEYGDEESPSRRGEEYDDEYEERVAREKRRVAQMQQQEAVLEKKHEELGKALEKALYAETVRAKTMYRIENQKKNTLDYAQAVYGDNADVSAIMNSADKAIVQSGKGTQKAYKEVSEKMKDLYGEHDKMVTMLSEGGEVREMPEAVADALTAYNGNSRKGMLDAALSGELSGYGEKLAAAKSKYENFEFTRNEEEKLRELQRRIAENDKKAAQFRSKAPKSMTQEEYAEMLRERRFKEFGDPSKGVVPDYVFTKEGVYTWNGRKLPVDGLSPEYLQEMQKQAQEPSYGG